MPRPKSRISYTMVLCAVRIRLRIISCAADSRRWRMTSTVMESTVTWSAMLRDPRCDRDVQLTPDADPADVAGVQHGRGGVLLHDGRARHHRPSGQQRPVDDAVVERGATALDAP